MVTPPRQKRKKRKKTSILPYIFFQMTYLAKYYFVKYPPPPPTPNCLKLNFFFCKKSPHYYTLLKQIPITLNNFNKFLLSYLEYSQKWLNLLMNDHHCGNIGGQKTRGKKNTDWYLVQKTGDFHQKNSEIWQLEKKICRHFHWPLSRNFASKKDPWQPGIWGP